MPPCTAIEGALLGASGLRAFSVGSLHEFVEWSLGRFPQHHSPPANITIDAAAISNWQSGVANEVLRPTVRTNKIVTRGKCWGAHRDIIYALTSAHARPVNLIHF
jgi:hypothetical protein